MTNVIPMSRGEPELRTPPHNVDAERALVGAILVNNKTYDHVVDFLRPEHFTEPATARVYEAMAKLIEGGAQANAVTLRTYLENDEIVRAAGGMSFVVKLSGSMVTTTNVREYGLLLVDLHTRREMIQFGQDVVNEAFDAQVGEPASDLTDAAIDRLFNIVSATDRYNSLTSLENAADSALILAEAAHKRDGALSGVTTGLTDLDRQIGGLHPSDLLILAGRPSMGKTALATAIAYNASRYFANAPEPDRGKQVAFFSLEMSHDQLATRILAHIAGLDSHRIRTGRLSNDEFHRLLEAKQELLGIPFNIDDQPAASVGAIRTRCRRIARRKGSKGLGLVVIDYLQLMAPSSHERENNRVLQLGAMTRGLKAMAKDLNVPVLCLSQLSRAVEQRDDKRPQLSDLRESGTIEQDSDGVIFVFREQYYLERQQPQQKPEETTERFHERFTRYTEKLEAVQNIAEIIIAKQRHGPIGTIKAHFNGPTTWFADLAKERTTQHYMQGMD